MKVYNKAVNANISIQDHNYLPIPELSEEMLSEKNCCLFCMKYQKDMEVRNLQDFSHSPCREMHMNALRESHVFGGSYTYACPLGFLFWTSPIYIEERFAGGLTGSGIPENESNEVCERMYSMCNGAVSKEKLEQQIKHFPRVEPRKIKALSELMRICAQSLSVKSEGHHAAMKRRAMQQSELSARIEEIKNMYPPGSPRPEYPMDKEQKLLDALKQGDIISGKKILNEILAVLVFAGSGEYKSIQCRAIELAVLISRVDTDPGFNAGVMNEKNNSFVKSVQEAANIEELADALYRIIEELAVQIHSFKGILHPSALKKAEYYILENFTRKISLEEIAKASGFSAPYFSTIFKEEMGENFSSYLNRLRVEKAKSMLANTNMALSKIARTCGFEDQSWFSKTFKVYTGISPGKYRSQGMVS